MDRWKDRYILRNGWMNECITVNTNRRKAWEKG